ncbi:unnamed protein product [Ceutorhynchus assimilis]|uniref:Lipase domain-containing protein n=1 Tax=Ceutorhynchus assimilis TaxID=467358 RepID=A0A9N9MLN2_9CUCU|nr:unnamed protein product [Ceutorhynchus assimilis]
MVAKSSTYLITIIFSALILLWFPATTVSQKNGNSTPPDIDQFLSSIFNLPLHAIQALAKYFIFSSKISSKDIEIISYKPNNKNETTNLSSTKDISLSADEKIVIIVHGFQSQATADWVKSLASAYHNIGIKNTLAINWQKIAKQFYSTAAEATKMVGEMVGEWLFDNILQQNSSKLENIHLVGHSLGAHVAGFIAKKISNLTDGEKVYRVSGLDVAAPLFEYPIKLPTTSRLDRDDAQNVDVYHTDGGLFGFLSPTGQQDFYVNYGGPIQPGCEGNILESVECSHSFSHKLFTKTLNSSDYIAIRCDNTELAKTGECDNNIAVTFGQNINGSDYGSFYGFVDSNADPVIGGI